MPSQNAEFENMVKFGDLLPLGVTGWMD